MSAVDRYRSCRQRFTVPRFIASGDPENPGFGPRHAPRHRLGFLLLLSNKLNSDRVFVAAERNVFDREKLFALHAPLDTLDKLYIHVIINYNKEGKRWMSHSVKSKIPIENNDKDKHAADTLVIRMKTQKSQSDQPEVYSGVTWESIPEPLTFDVFFQMNGDKKEILKREPDFESFSLEITGIPEKSESK